MGGDFDSEYETERDNLNKVVTDPLDPYVQSTPQSILKPLFKKDVRFGWGLCGLSSSAELLLNPTKSIAVGGSILDKKVFIEGKHYFKENHTGTFASLRASSRMNLGFVFGRREEFSSNGFGIFFTSKIGLHLNRNLSISPTIGIGWELN